MLLQIFYVGKASEYTSDYKAWFSLLFLWNPSSFFILVCTSLLTAEVFWLLCDLYLRFIPPINLWNKCIDLRLFLECLKGPFLRPLISKDIRGWILRLSLQKSLTNSERLAANVEKVCMTNGYKVLFYLTLISFFARLTRVSLWSTIKKSNQSELWNCLSYRGLPYFFEVGSQTFRAS